MSMDSYDAGNEHGLKAFTEKNRGSSNSFHHVSPVLPTAPRGHGSRTSKLMAAPMHPIC